MLLPPAWEGTAQLPQPWPFFLSCSAREKRAHESMLLFLSPLSPVLGARGVQPCPWLCPAWTKAPGPKELLGCGATSPRLPLLGVGARTEPQVGSSSVSSPGERGTSPAPLLPPFTVTLALVFVSAPASHLAICLAHLLLLRMPVLPVLTFPAPPVTCAPRSSSLRLPGSPGSPARSSWQRKVSFGYLAVLHSKWPRLMPTQMAAGGRGPAGAW